MVKKGQRILEGVDIEVTTIDQVKEDPAYPNAGYGNVSIGTTAGTIVSADTDRKALIIQNLGAGNLYIGFDSTVTTTNGFKLASGESLEINGYRGAVYGIGDATCDVRYLEIKK